MRKISECSECFKEHIGLLLEIEIERLIDVTNDPDWRSMILQDWQTGVFALRGSEILHIHINSSGIDTIESRYCCH